MLALRSLLRESIAWAPALIATAALPVAVHAQDFGRITGRVETNDSRTPVVGARVSIAGSTYAVTTSDQGTFTLPRVPEGSHTLTVSYIGRAPLTRQITVTHTTPVVITFTLDPIALSPVMVRATGQAEALSRQQNAPNIKSVVASDQMGRFPDASAPEALQRLPGVALQRDQGEGRYVQIRGSSAATTQVTVNGEQIGSPEAESRQTALDAIPVGVLSAIEVAKAITPDMDADAIGGSVNLVTKRAGFGRTFTVEGSGGYGPLRERGSGNGAITFGNRTSSGRLGWLLSGSFGERNFGSDDIEPDYDDDDLAELDVRHYTLWRRRTGGTAAIDFKASDRSTFYVTSLWSELQDQEQRRRITHAVEDGELAYFHKNRLEKLSTFNILAGGEHALSRGISLGYRFGFTRSQEDTPFDHEISFLQEDVAFSPSRANPEAPQTNPAGNALAGTYVFDEFSTGGTLTRNRDLTSTLNLSVPFSFGANGSGVFRLGGKVRNKNKDQKVDAFVLGLADDAEDIVLGANIGRSFTNNGFNPGSYPIPFTTNPGEIAGFVSRFGGQLGDRETDPEAQVGAYDLTERVSAGYALAELTLSPRLLLLPGVRFEHTNLTANGNDFDGEEETLSRARATNSYSNVFPMAHLRYRMNDATNVRAAFTTTIFRPNFVDLIPFVVRDDEDLERGNPALKPTTARNYDLMFERYDRNVGLVSAGVFFKQLDKPIFVSTTDNDLGGETTEPVNAESGEIVGFEVAVQKRLTFLPGALDGLGLYANFTWTDSKATHPTGRETRLAGQAERAFNVALSYEKHGFSGQVSVNQVGRYIDELGDSEEDDLFADARTQVDVSASYFVTRSWQVFVDGLNLTNQPFRTFAFRSDRVRQLEFYEASVQLGVRFRP